MPFIERRDHYAHQERDSRPRKRPKTCATQRQRRPPRTEEEVAEDKEADNVTCFAEIVMPDVECEGINWAENPTYDGIEHTACVLGREQIRRFECDDRDPD